MDQKKILLNTKHI